MRKEMQELEESLLHTDFNFSNNKAALEEMLADDFEEVSPQGQITPRAAVIQWLLQKNSDHRWRFSEMQVTELSTTARLVRYHAVQIVPASQSRGSQHCSIWCHDAQQQRWRMRFHQSSKVS